jgi:beta-lactamase class A
MITEAGYSGQTPVYNDPTSEDGRPTIANYIKKIFLVSDNDAFNRLYEFLGQEYINSQLKKMGYTNAQILHRLEIFLSEDENRHTNPVKFLTEEGRNVYQQPMQFNEQPFAKRRDFMGKSHYAGDKLVKDPMNFSKKNKIPLEDLHNMLTRVFFPESFPENERFNLKPEDYQLVWKYMSQLPSETVYPKLDTSIFHSTYAKFLYFGNDKSTLPENMRIFNKIGDAYGCMTDVAYFVDFQQKVEFFLSATIYCNKDGIMNDDKYDYDTVGFPFMKQLGQIIYDYELKREREHAPDLSRFLIKYDR